MKCLLVTAHPLKDSLCAHLAELIVAERRGHLGR